MSLIGKDTTIGKTLYVAFWVALSGAVAALIAWVANVDLGNYVWLVPGVNVVLVFVKNLADRNVANY